MKNFLFSIFVLAAPSSAFAGWGAIAYSAVTGESSQAHGFDNQVEAYAAALKTCGYSDCYIVNWEHNECIAFATNCYRSGEAHGYTNDTLARWAAENQCGSDCTWKQWACD